MSVEGEAALIGRLRGARTCLVVATAGCVWDDLKLAGPADRTVVVGRMGLHYPGEIDGWIKWGHRAELEAWGPTPERVALCLIGHECPSLAFGTEFHEYGGDSALFAAHLAIVAGVPQIILAGVPMQAEFGCCYDPTKDKACLDHHRWSVQQYFDRWPERRAFVRSCSGWTRELLGPPTPEWLA